MMVPNENEDKDLYRYVYSKRRAIFPQKLKDGGFIFTGMTYYRVIVAKYNQNSSTRHEYIRSDNISEEGFLALKLRERNTISKKELDRRYKELCNTN